MLKRNFFIYLALSLLILLSIPFISTSLIKYLENNQVHLHIDDVKSADAVIVLGGMLTSAPSVDGTEFEWSDPDRFFGGIDLALDNKAYYLIFTGGGFPWERVSITEGNYLKRKAMNYGIAKDRILITKPAQNTEEEAIAVKDLLNEKLGNEQKKIILVTSAFHMPRAKSMFERNGFMVSAYPVDFRANISSLTPMSFLPSAYALKDVEFSLRELMGRIYYSIKAI